MFIRIGRDRNVSLVEPDDLKRLHIAPEDSNMSLADVERALASIAVRENDNFWIGVDELKALSGRSGDADWEASFSKMIASVQRFGWLSPDGRRVRCHVKAD
jgi:hypothetical protein